LVGGEGGRGGEGLVVVVMEEEEGVVEIPGLSSLTDL
jgi:hypothetical protein